MTTTVQFVGGLDANFAWNGSRLFTDDDYAAAPPALRELRGAAAQVLPAPDGTWRVLRDPLGINKLFWVRDDGGTVVIAARPRRLVERGHAFEEVRAIPRGSLFDLNPSIAGGVEMTDSLLPRSWARPVESTAGVAEIGGEIRSTLERYLAALAAAHRPDTVFICLSGGLDSTGIAVLAREHFPNSVAVSFDLEHGGAGESDDRIVALRVARDLGLSLLEVTIAEDELFEMLDIVLVEGIDWREFNVHAALVNAALARGIADTMKRNDRESALILTGDLANEFLADYHPESYGGMTYYELPVLETGALRTALVQGLDSSHREVGVFAAWDLQVVQPYAAAVDGYLSLPSELLGSGTGKQRLYRTIFGNRLPSYVYKRPKVRAQVGGADASRGVLAACAERGLDSAYLARRFAELHGLTDTAPLTKFILGGRYRAAVPWSSHV